MHLKHLLKKIVVFFLSFSLFFLLFGEKNVLNANYLFNTSGYGFEQCSPPLSACNDYYSNHFNATFIASGQPGDAYWRVISAESVSVQVENQFGDEWTTENFRIYNTGANLVYEDNFWAPYMFNINSPQTFFMNVNVIQNSGMVWFYYKYDLKDSSGRTAQVWHPMRYRQNF